MIDGLIALISPFNSPTSSIDGSFFAIRSLVVGMMIIWTEPAVGSTNCTSVVASSHRGWQ